MQHFNKPAGISQATLPHQDGYFHPTAYNAVAGWLAIEHVGDVNGCIHCVCRSNKMPSFHPHCRTRVLGFSQGITNYGTEQDNANSVSFPGVPGTFLMHDAKPIHWAGANLSPSRSRRALGFIYSANSAQVDHAAKVAYQKQLDAQLKTAAKI